ncbi:transcriptional regulator [Vibrio ishigakensis]|uniref:Transcriptional regulator n=1 Tax=Vibrio ishigakensis TaxID=1481914 RepID=A0A0B8QL69_9VIBR|nr:transcriptional regulator [Vibrio ishigakensis]
MSYNQLPLIRVESAIIITETARDFFPSNLLHKAQEFLPIPLERGTLTIPAIPENAIIHFMQQLHQHADSEDFFLYLEESMKQLAKLWPIPSSSQCNNLVSILEYNVANFQSNSSQSLLSIEKEGFEQQVTLTLTTDEHYLERYSGTAIWLELQSLMFLVQYIRRILGDEWLPLSVGLQHAEVDEVEKHVPLAHKGLFVQREVTSITLSKQDAYTPLEIEPQSVSLPELSVQSLYSEQLIAALWPYTGERKLELGVCSELLNTSKRTIQRKLQGEGMTFRDIVDKLHVRFALAVLREDRFTVADVASHLGYANSSKFIRAFKRITGLPPMQYIQKEPR